MTAFRKSFALVPMMLGFYVMCFSDIIGTVMNQVKAECSLGDVTAGFMVTMIYIWFLLASIPAAVLCGRIGRKKTVLLSLVISLSAMVLPLGGGAGRIWPYFAAFALLGIGNTILQAALPALMTNILPPGKLTAGYAFGHFVKALGGASTPVVVFAAATWCGNWKLVFPLYALLTLVTAIILLRTDIPREPAAAVPASFLSCLRLLGNPYVAMLTGGVLFAVGADVGFNLAIPEYLKTVFHVDKDYAGLGPTVYFTAKTVVSLLGGFVFARFSAAKLFPWLAAFGLAATAAILAAPTPLAFFVCVALATIGSGNAFSICMGLAIARRPQQTNEIAALMVMAIAGGGVVAPALGILQKNFGGHGLVWTLLACFAYLTAVGLIAARKQEGVPEPSGKDKK